jgi:hypothetical protein
MCITYIYTHTHSDRENETVLLSLSEGATGGGREKQNDTEY